jgi:Cu(I)/Ag(I) efflux system membrane protein CusA/SilA
VGFIALFGLAIETAMLITIYLNEAMVVEKHGNSRETLTEEILRDYIIFGLQKITSQVNDGICCFVWISTYFMVNWNGADVMIPITVPLIGGTITSTIYVLLVTPVVLK